MAWNISTAMSITLSDDVMHFGICCLEQQSRNTMNSYVI